jgi:hypothetical protein
MNMRSILTLAIAGAATLASPAMTLAAPTLTVAPFAIAKMGNATTQISAVTESRRHRHVRMKHVAFIARSHVNRNVDSFASYNGMRGVAVPAVKPVNPGDPGNPYLNDSFDRSVARHQYNGS